MTDTVLAEVLRALDIAIVERLADARFQGLGASPAWLEAAFDAAPAGARGTLSGALPFLDHFLKQADAAWYAGGSVRASSGPFVAQLAGEEVLLRATALTLEHRLLLVIERLTEEADPRPILQKAREQALATEQLARRASAVHAPAAAIGRIAAELSATALGPAQRQLVDALSAASADLAAVVDVLPKPPTKGRRFSSNRDRR